MPPSAPRDAPAGTDPTAAAGAAEADLIATLQDGLRPLRETPTERSDPGGGERADNAGLRPSNTRIAAKATPAAALAVPKFLHPDGLTVRLDVEERDSLFFRIEALRMYLEKELGLDDFVTVYRFLNDSILPEAEQRGVRDRPLEMLVAPKAIEFLPLVHQLIVCEDQCFTH